MYWIWFFLFVSQPAFCLLGYFDVLGSEAKKAAEDIFAFYAIVGGLVVVGVVILLIVKVFGVA